MAQTKKQIIAEVVARRKPTPKQIKAAKLLSENIGKAKPKPAGKVLQEAGYSKEMSESPGRIIDSPTVQDLLAKYLPDQALAKTHNKLLKTKRLDHMVFPLGPEGKDDPNLSGAQPNAKNQVEKSGVKVERTTLTDKEIIAMLKEVNCVVRRIVHGDSARHVYFWADDAMAQKAALELAYKVRGIATREPPGGNTFNFNFGEQSNARRYVDAEQTN